MSKKDVSRRRRRLAQALYGSLAESDGRDSTQELLDERRAEAEREKPVTDERLVLRRSTMSP